MFGFNYNSEKTLKFWAKALKIIGIMTIISFSIAFFVLLGTIINYIWWLPFAVFYGGLIIGLILILTSHIVWGFGDIVGNVNRISEANIETEKPIDAKLPEI